jgi:hypothetical protein
LGLASRPVWPAPPSGALVAVHDKVDLEEEPPV